MELGVASNGYFLTTDKTKGAADSENIIIFSWDNVEILHSIYSSVKSLNFSPMRKFTILD